MISEFQERYGADLSVRRIVKKLDNAYLQVLGEIGYLQNKLSVNLENSTYPFSRSQGIVTDPDMTLEDWFEYEGGVLTWPDNTAQIVVSNFMALGFRNTLNTHLPYYGNYYIKLRAKFSGTPPSFSLLNMRIRLTASDLSYINIEVDSFGALFSTQYFQIENSENVQIEAISLITDDEDHGGYTLVIDELDIVNVDEMELPTGFYEVKDGVNFNNNRIAPIDYSDVDYTTGTPLYYYIRRIGNKDVIGVYPRASTGILECNYSEKDTVFSDLFDSNDEIVSSKLDIEPKIEEAYHEMIILKAGINLGMAKNPMWQADKVDYADMRGDLVRLKSKHRDDGVVCKPIDF